MFVNINGLVIGIAFYMSGNPINTTYGVSGLPRALCGGHKKAFSKITKRVNVSQYLGSLPILENIKQTRNTVHAERWPNLVLSFHLDLMVGQNDVHLLLIYRV